MKILLLAAAFYTLSVYGDDSEHPPLDAKGLVGVNNCGTKNDFIKIVSLTVETCDKTPCQVSAKDVLTLTVEFMPLENIPSLSTAVTAILPVGKLPMVAVDSCKVLSVGQCPYIKGETYVQAILFDMPKLATPSIEKFLKENGQISGVTEIVISNPENLSSVCVSYAVNVVA